MPDLYTVEAKDTDTLVEWMSDNKAAQGMYFPAGVPFRDTPNRNGAKIPIKHTQATWSYYGDLNRDKTENGKLLAYWIANGICNQPENKHYDIPNSGNTKIYIPEFFDPEHPPVTQPLLSLGNLVNVVEKRFANGEMWARIETVPFKTVPDTLPKWLKNDPFTSVLIDSDGNILDMGHAIHSGGIIYPYWAKGEAWVPMAFLKKYEEVEEVSDFSKADFIDTYYREGATNWRTVLDHTDGAILKVGDGWRMPKRKDLSGNWVDWSWHYDPMFPQWYRQIVNAKVRGGYWYFRLDYERSPDSYPNDVEQAELFYERMKNNYLLESDYIVADIERGGWLHDAEGNPYRAWKDTTFGQRQERIYNFLQRCEELFGRKPIIYCSYYGWEELVGFEKQWPKEYKLWLASYRRRDRVEIPEPWATWDNVWAWQYTDKARIQGTSGDMDANLYEADFEHPPEPEQDMRPAWVRWILRQLS